MTVIAPGIEPLDRADADPAPARLAEFSAPFKKELSGVIDRLISEAAHELDAVLARAEAQSDTALQAAEAALADQRQRHDDLAESFAKGEKQVEELRMDLEREREHALTATQAFEGAESARLRAEAAIEEARAVREGMVSAYESRLKAVHEELDTMRATTARLQQQLEAEGAERARLVATIRTVQQAFASVDPVAAVRPRHAAIAPTGDDATPAVSHEHDETSAVGDSSRSLPHADRIDAGATADYGAAAAARLPGSTLRQIEAIYEEDQRSRPLTEVVDRLTANLRCARDMFVKRANAAASAARRCSISSCPSG